MKSFMARLEAYKKRRAERKMNRRKQRGYTLTELLTVLVILGCVGAVAVPAYTQYITRARTGRINAVIDAVATAKSNYLADPNTTDAQRTTFDSATEAARLTTLIGAGLNVNGKAVTAISDLVVNTGQTALTIGNSTTAPTIP